MGYNTNFILAKNLTEEELSDIIPDVFEITNEVIDFESASSHNLSPSFAWNRIGDWSIIWDATGKLVLDRSFIQQFSQNSVALSLGFSSVDDKYSFIYVAHSKIIRQLTMQAGKVVLADGQKLDSEPEILDEDTLWQLMTAVSNVTFRQLQDARYALISID